MDEDVDRMERDHEMRTYRLRYVGTGAKSPEIFPKSVPGMFAVGSEVRNAPTA